MNQMMNYQPEKSNKSKSKSILHQSLLSSPSHSLHSTNFPALQLNQSLFILFLIKLSSCLFHLSPWNSKKSFFTFTFKCLPHSFIIFHSPNSKSKKRNKNVEHSTKPSNWTNLITQSLSKLMNLLTWMRKRTEFQLCKVAFIVSTFRTINSFNVPLMDKKLVTKQVGN